MSILSAFPTPPSRLQRIFRGALKFALVLGLHGVLVAWLASHAAQLRETQINIAAQPAPPSYKAALDVRMINTPPPETPKPVTAPPRPLPQTQQAVVHQPEPITPPPVLTAAPDANQDTDPAPVAFSVSPQPPTPPQEEEAAPPMPATAARFDADYLQNPAPIYPAMSRRLREEGQVLLLVDITAQGEAKQVRIKQRSGFSRLDEAALNAVRQWRFVPARRGEEPIAASVVVPIVFSLDG